MKGTCTFGLPPEAIARLESIRVHLSPGVQPPVVTEAEARQQEALSHNEIDQKLRELIEARHSARWAYLEAVYDDFVIYSVSVRVTDGDRETSKTLPGGDEFFAAPYTVGDEDAVMLGEPFVVTRVVSYVRRDAAAAESRTGESAADDVEEFYTDVVDFAERAVAADGTFPVKLIQPGWGSSGFYSKEVLARDAPKVYKRGTQMFWNHQTKAEEAERPEGNLHHLAAVIVTDPAYDEGGTYGPGVYAKAKAFGDYKERIEEMAPHIGVSLRGRGRGVVGEAEGRKGRVFTELLEDFRSSVDFVTKPGAGGQVVEMFESARSGAQPTPPKEAPSMDELREAQNRVAELEGQVTTLTESQATLTTENAQLKGENAQLKERDLLAKARGIVEAAVGAAKLPDVTKTRLVETLATNPPVVEGAIDEAAYATAITEAVDVAAQEVAAIKGSPVTGMGPGSAGGDSGGTGRLKEAMRLRYIDQGKSEAEAEKLATLAVSGR